MIQQQNPTAFIWFNADTNAYEIGDGPTYKTRKRNSTNPTGYTLLYKLNPTSSRLGEKLILELNKAHTESCSGSNTYEFILTT